MPKVKHASALASHYDHEATYYDTHNEENSRVVNATLEAILKRHGAKTVLDLSCGTGSQLFWLTQRGFLVHGVDINKRMLAKARLKAKTLHCALPLQLGDMRTVHVGIFDAAITIFNAIGHLTKRDFKKAVKNIARQLKPGGLYIFDINNLDYLLHDNNITSLTIDWQMKSSTATHRVVQHSTINQHGVLASYTTTYEQKGTSRFKIHHSMQTLQVYRESDLRALLEQCGFTHVHLCAIDGGNFHPLRSDRMLVVAERAK